MKSAPVTLFHASLGNRVLQSKLVRALSGLPADPNHELQGLLYKMLGDLQKLPVRCLDFSNIIKKRSELLVPMQFVELQV